MQQGNALMIVMVLFVVIALAIGSGLIAPVIRANRIATNNLESKRSYFIAESGIEDVLYRLRTSKHVSTSEALVLGTQHTTTTITNLIGGNKKIEALGDVVNRNRMVTMVLTQGTGMSFNYGVQTGRGGVILGNNSQIIGNVYANGDITGSGSITETAVAANTSALTADQINDTPTTPASSINFRHTTTAQDFAQSFQITESAAINKVQLYIKKVGVPANAEVRIVSDTNGSPSTNDLIATPGTLSASSVTTSYGWVDVTFATNPTLYAGVTYWIIIDNSTNSASNYYTIAANTATYTTGAAQIGSYGGTWNTQTTDGYFKVYVGGLTSQINGVAVGTAGNGDAWAHTIVNSTVSNIKYCQVGTGCNTSRADPPPTDFPVSDANIATWKEEASTGATITGDYTPANNSTLGPKVITGNLNITNGQTVTLTGRVWVKGDVTLSNNSMIKLAASYGADDEVLVADGTILIRNNGAFAGSGTTGSYVMALTTSDCPTSASCSGDYAIDVSNNAGAVILNAQKGTIHLNNNAELIEATGETLLLDPNAIITYISGLSDMNFSSGPGGAWNISSWKETQ